MGRTGIPAIEQFPELPFGRASKSLDHFIQGIRRNIVPCLRPAQHWQMVAEDPFGIDLGKCFHVFIDKLLGGLFILKEKLPQYLLCNPQFISHFI